ncbi:MAG: PLP-dependent cysteine synthase family protein [Aigarchaeota archaeon]|nr:PLP-dependent cysteine synthase family protein [Aigarchaeota archaeon]MDW8092253.1 PLP-dependent cysteine synthase family protein [Nitrososphaerota archaeon]
MLLNKRVIYENALGLIGNTPMVKINRLVGKGDATILAKLENYNVGGSLKDRIAKYMIEAAEREGRLREGMTILEATSGNTGIGLAVVAAVKGYKLKVVMPDNVSVERRRLLQALGAEVILTPGEKGTAGAIELVREIVRRTPGEYFVPDQFNNINNVKAHYETTGREILEQTGGRLDAVVVGIGTSGTAMGVGRRVKEYNPNIRLIGVEPVLGQRIQGLRNMREPFPPSLFDPMLFDERYFVTESESIRTARDLARLEGLVMGISSGAVMSVAVRKAKSLGSGKTVVVILPDGGERYLSTELFAQGYSPEAVIISQEHG